MNYCGEGARWSLRLAAKRSFWDDLAVKYRVTASDFHLPSSLISDFAIPASIAELAAPRRNECPEKVDGLLPERRIACCKEVSIHFLVKGPVSLLNSGRSGDKGYLAKMFWSAL